MIFHILLPTTKEFPGRNCGEIPPGVPCCGRSRVKALGVTPRRSWADSPQKHTRRGDTSGQRSRSAGSRGCAAALGTSDRDRGGDGTVWPPRPPETHPCPTRRRAGSWPGPRGVSLGFLRISVPFAHIYFPQLPSNQVQFVGENSPMEETHHQGTAIHCLAGHAAFPPLLGSFFQILELVQLFSVRQPLFW